GFGLGELVVSAALCYQGLCRAVRLDLLGHVVHREYDVYGTGGDGTLRHAAVLGLARMLRQGEAAVFLDLANSERAVRTGTAQDYTDGLLAVCLGERSQKMIDRRTLDTPTLQLRQTQVGVDGIEVGIGRNHVDVVRLQRSGLHHLTHRHLRVRLQRLHEVALVLGRKMHYHHTRKTRFRGHATEEGAQRFQAAGGCADTDDAEIPG